MPIFSYRCDGCKNTEDHLVQDIEEEIMCDKSIDLLHTMYILKT